MAPQAGGCTCTMVQARRSSAQSSGGEGEDMCGGAGRALFDEQARTVMRIENESVRQQTGMRTGFE